ncbi:MAG: type II toxin-antitoxin system YafQ family toxin [Bacteroidaceae bacterium]|nr:type II toxin-antitoxin system YafQ family toxin [Bacteroidaceae bacterium]
MKTIKYSTRYKKDIKRYANHPDKLEALYQVVQKLEQGLPIPPEHHPHQLKGEYKGCWECHIQSDFLLIWIDEATDTIWLERLGSHSELFKK